MNKKQRSEFESSIVETLVRHAEDSFELLARGPDAVEAGTSDEWTRLGTWSRARNAAREEAFLHWETAFPGVWRDWQNVSPTGGFDAVIGNPPWDRIEQQENEWFAVRDEEVALAATGAERKALIEQRIDEGNELALEYAAARNKAATLRAMVRSTGRYPLLSGGRINLYSLFVERAMGLIKPTGFVGLLTPSGIYADKTAALFFRAVSTGGRLAGLFDFENRRLGTRLPPFFPDVDSRFKFCALVFGGDERRFSETKCAFFLHDTATVNDPDRSFPLAPSDFAKVNPNTGTAPVFRNRRDAAITVRIYEQHPVLVDRSRSDEQRAWSVAFMQGLFNMTSDSDLFRTAPELRAERFYPVGGNRWKKGDELYLPLYQGRMIHQFDHRANSVVSNPENVHNPYLSEEVTETQHADPGFLPATQYWVPSEEVEETLSEDCGYTLGFRDIARPTDVRTVIAAIVPWAGYGNTLPLLLGGDALGYACLVGNLNAMCADFVSRQKAQGTHLNWYIVEQLPVIAPDDYDRQFGATTARELVRDHVLRLTYTAHDMAPFARDLGYDGPPFIWDEEERRHLRARLDALYFHLYGLDKDDPEYVLGTFPIVRRDDEKQFGSYRTRDLVLAYMDALAAGDTDSQVAI